MLFDFFNKLNNLIIENLSYLHFLGYFNTASNSHLLGTIELKFASFTRGIL